MQNSKKINSWSKIFIQPKYLIIVVTLWLCFAWFLWLSNDIFGLFDTGLVMWTRLFNDRPVEFTQWYILGFAIFTGAYISGRLHLDSKYKEMSKFFFIFSVGLALMLVEEAGDIRHYISREARSVFGDSIYDINIRVVMEVPYFAILSIIPIYSVLKYRKEILKTVTAKYYLAVGFVFYAIVAIGSGFRHFQDLYIRIGRVLDNYLLQNRFPISGHSQDRAHFLLVDSVIEESMELIAATMMLAMMLAFIQEYKKHQNKNKVVAEEDKTSANS